MVPSKFVSLDELAIRMAVARSKESRVVQCHGCFDPLHIGHLRHFRAAREAGDMLIVTVTPDRYVDKGPGRPIQDETIRAEAVAALQDVDLVAINAWPTVVETLRLLRPDVYAKGIEFRTDDMDPTGKIALERREANRLGIHLMFTDTMVEHSTTLIQRMKAAGIGIF